MGDFLAAAIPPLFLPNNQADPNRKGGGDCQRRTGTGRLTVFTRIVCTNFVNAFRAKNVYAKLFTRKVFVHDEGAE